MNILNFIRRIACFFCKMGIDVPSPPDMIPHENILYSIDKELLEVRGILPYVWITGVQDTNSMDGLLDFGHSVILSNNEEYFDKFLVVGSVIVYNKGEGSIIHQIVEVGEDDRWFCYTQGVNCPVKDLGKVRREDIKWVALGIIW